MTTAVMKNRLLDLTDRTFDEADWGATTTREFVERLAPTLALDFSTRPTTVILHPDIDVSDQETVVAVEPARRRGDWRIRQDLWDAVVDCVSGHAYVWDGSHATPRAPEDLEKNFAVLLPTVTPEELTAWRESFASEVRATVDSDLQTELDRWRRSAASSQMLPQRYRNRWYGVSSDTSAPGLTNGSRSTESNLRRTGSPPWRPPVPRLEMRRNICEASLSEPSA